MNQKEIRQIVERVTAEIDADVLRSRKTFRVPDVLGQMEDFGTSLDKAWSISYSTASAVANLERPGLNEAWSISYSTASLADVAPAAKKGK